MKRLLIILAVFIGAQLEVQAQLPECKTWNDSPQKEEGENQHSIYRPLVRNKNYERAFPHWEKAFNIAPAADGRRDYHYEDGITIYKHFLETATDDAKKEEYKQKILDLYQGMINCYENKVIKVRNCDDLCLKAVIGQKYGRMAYDMFYTLSSPYDKTLEAIEKAVEYGDKGTEYVVLEPWAHIVTYQFKQGSRSAEEVRTVYDRIMEIADYNIETDMELGEYFDITKRRSEAVFKPIEKEIFDCEYFKEKLKPMYEQDPDNFDVLKYVFNTLRQQGCDDADPFLTKIKSEYETLAAEYNEERLKELEEKNPAYAARKRYDEGKFEEAAEKYEEAIEKETDNEKKAQYYFALASIQFRKMDKYSDARKSALEASKLRPDWGRPYMLIGDMYATTSRNCGDAWNQRLAVLAAIDKYAKAKAVDSDFDQEASSRIAKYHSSRPEQGDAFMRGLENGSTTKVGCWIAETVTLRF